MIEDLRPQIHFPLTNNIQKRGRDNVYNLS